MNLSRFLRFAREFHIAPGPGPSAAARSGDNHTYIHIYMLQYVSNGCGVPRVPGSRKAADFGVCSGRCAT